MSQVNLTFTPDIFKYSVLEYKDLEEDLKQVDAATVVSPVLSPESDIFLQPDGKTKNGYMFSEGAFSSLCAITSPGLVSLVPALSGQWRTIGEDPREFSPELAISTFNKVIKLRFNRLAGIQMVKNTKKKTIDGVVGTKYRYLSNGDFLQRVTDTVKRNQTTFKVAYVYGRELVIRFIHETQSYSFGGEQHSYGFHFANSEIGGAAVRAAFLLFRGDSEDCALGPFRGSVGHHGKEFERKLHGLLDSVLKKAPKHIDEERLSQSLRLGGQDHQERCKHLSTTLRNRDLPLQFTKRVVSATTSLGSDDDSLADIIDIDRSKIIQERTLYDLYVSLIREAQQLPIWSRENAEQTAYQLLTGKITP